MIDISYTEYVFFSYIRKGKSNAQIKNSLCTFSHSFSIVFNCCIYGGKWHIFIYYMGLCSYIFWFPISDGQEKIMAQST